MSTARTARVIGAAAIAAVAALALSACGSSSSIAGPTATSAGGSIVIGSQAYYSNEIIAEIYAQALEGAGKTVTRQFNIGQRDAYIPQLKSGAITLFPEYSGNLLQYFDANTTARSADDVYAALQTALPSNLTVLNQSTATDQDSYTVTKAFADKYGLGDLREVGDGGELSLIHI